VKIQVKVVTKAAKSEVVGWENEYLKVRLHALPEKGKANQELIRVLAKHFAIPPSQIQILQPVTAT
jgi:uncharacterized protein